MPLASTAAARAGGAAAQPRTPPKTHIRRGYPGTPPSSTKAHPAGPAPASGLSSSKTRSPRAPPEPNGSSQTSPQSRTPPKTAQKPAGAASSPLRPGVLTRHARAVASQASRAPSKPTSPVKSSRKGAAPAKAATPQAASGGGDTRTTSATCRCTVLAPPKILRPSPDWTVGNFEVITSDDVLFIVDDYVLFSASPVFVTAHDVAAYSQSPPERRIHFIDPELETSDVFAAFLTLTSTLRIPLEPPSVWVSLIRFLRKWDCTALHDLLFTHLRAHLQELLLDRLVVFAIGAELGDTELCKRAIRTLANSWGTTWLAHPDCDALNPAEWTLQFWEQQRIPPRYLFALIRAWHRTQARGSRDDFAAEFGALLADPTAGSSK